MNRIHLKRPRSCISQQRHLGQKLKKNIAFTQSYTLNHPGGATSGHLIFDSDHNFQIIKIILGISENSDPESDFKSLRNFKLYASQVSEESFHGIQNLWKITRIGLIEIVEKYGDYLDGLKSSHQYQIIKDRTADRLNFCQQQWLNNFEKTASIVGDITGLIFLKKLPVTVFHPAICAGANIGDHILWGGREDWPNYTTVYLWHETLHSYFPKNGLTHAIIQLIIDNELNFRLNGVQYPPFTGHSSLFEIMTRLLPDFREYLGESHRNIFQFCTAMTEKYPEFSKLNL